MTLADARRRAREEREKAVKGTDPIHARKAAASLLRAEVAKAITFKAAALAYIEAHESGWRNAKHAEQWRNTPASTYPAIGGLQVRDMELPQVLAVLEPIWKAKTETAKRLRGRVESVLDWATARGYRDGLNPVRWKGHLDHLLADPNKIMKQGHQAALPIGEVGAFMAALRLQEGTGARALEFAILTAARSGEVRGTTWLEIDTDAATWTVPAERMKAGDEHRVPLAADALKLLKELPRMAGTDLVFPAPRGGKLSEMALAHTIGNKVEAAYRRGDLFEKRRLMMADWAKFLARPEVKAQVIETQSARTLTSASV